MPAGTKKPSHGDWSFVPIRQVRNLLTGLQQNGTDTSALVDLYGLTPSRLELAYASVTVPQFRQIVRTAIELSAKPSLGLLVGQRNSMSDYGLAGLLASSFRTLGEWGAAIRPYEFLAQSMVRVEIDFTKTTFTVRAVPNFAFGSATRYCNDTWAAELISQSRLLSGDDDVNPQTVQLPYPRPSDTSAYEGYFRCPVSFGHDYAAVHVPLSVLDMPIPDYDPDTNVRLRAAGTKGTDKTWDIMSTIKEAIAANPSTYSNANEIADLIGISERQLRRHLRASGTSVRAIINDTRHGLAEEYLAHSELSVTDISQRLGYSDVASFRKACQRWTGMSPRELRRQLSNVRK